MIKFDDDYFKDEYRCDFLVPEKMKRAWAAQQEVLSEIIRVCDKYDIVYYAEYGTLLGAVRHKGFIPWDDDIDLSMPRKDYEKLFRVASYELPKTYVLNSVYSNDKLTTPMGCIMNRATVETDALLLKDFHGCPYIVGVDIYPLDNIPDDEELAQAYMAMYNMVYDAAQRFDKLKQTNELWGYLLQIEELCRVKLVRDDTLQFQLWALAENIAAMFADDDTKRIASLWELTVKGKKRMRKKEWYRTVEKRPFEKIKINVPNGYDEVLRLIYGDYMMPVRGGGDHDYPFYKKQDEWMKQNGLKVDKESV